MDFAALEDFLIKNNYPEFRFRQIIKNYFSGHFRSFDTMSDLPLDLRQNLAKNFEFISVSEQKTSTSSHTQKSLLKLTDGQTIETVKMDYGSWITACVSSQVGCPLACRFCATGQMGFVRNLTSQEIVDQIVYWNQLLSPAYIGRLVFMGMGEPFLNWDNLIEALAIINSRHGLNIGQRKISISTAGVTHRIRDFADLKSQVNLAISLHSLDPVTRLDIMPVTKKYPLPELLDSALYYVTTTRRQLVFEYALIKGVNDSDQDLAQLIRFIRSNYLYFLNLIPLNYIAGGLVPSPKSRLDYFVDVLTRQAVNFSVRRSLGDPIEAACGQLARYNNNSPAHKAKHS